MLTQEEKERDNFRDSDDTYDNDLYLCPSNQQVRSPAVLKTYEINVEYHNPDNPSNRVQGIAGMVGPKDSRVGWSTQVNEISNASEAIVLMEFHSFFSILGLGSSGIRAGIISKNYSPGAPFIAHDDQVGGVSGFYVHDDRSYKSNFLMADGSVQYIGFANTMGSQRGAFYTGTHVGSANLQGTYWDTLQ